MTDAVGMTLTKVRDALGCEVLVATPDWESVRVQAGCGADLMSDVLAFIKSGALLLTGLTNAQAVRTAEVADVRAVIYVRSKRPDASAMALAQELGLPLLATPLPMFEACGRLRQAGLRGCTETPAGGARGNELHQGV
jgi:DRTGG domain